MLNIYNFNKNIYTRVILKFDKFKSSGPKKIILKGKYNGVLKYLEFVVKY